jgi:hypothetical protein
LIDVDVELSVAVVSRVSPARLLHPYLALIQGKVAISDTTQHNADATLTTNGSKQQSPQQKWTSIEAGYSQKRDGGQPRLKRPPSRFFSRLRAVRSLGVLPRENSAKEKRKAKKRRCAG